MDLGCGDWQFSRLMDWSGVEYCGLEVVPSLVAKLQAEHGAPGRRFALVDPSDPRLPPADLLIAKDVLQHVSNAEILRLMGEFRKYRHLLLTNDKNPDPNGNNGDTHTGGYRLLDLSASPFGLKGNYVFYFGPDWHKYTFWVHNT